jgi:hypothetical protein
MSFVCWVSQEMICLGQGLLVLRGFLFPVPILQREVPVPYKPGEGHGPVVHDLAIRPEPSLSLCDLPGELLPGFGLGHPGLRPENDRPAVINHLTRDQILLSNARINTKETAGGTLLEFSKFYCHPDRRAGGSPSRIRNISPIGSLNVLLDCKTGSREGDAMDMTTQTQTDGSLGPVPLSFISDEQERDADLMRSVPCPEGIRVARGALLAVVLSLPIWALVWWAVVGHF